ncbi:hypothetical protein [Paraflavitalea sp. CAU 1676]|nr:hypothetical protein [Paraflavitalea sp. CAU 1676]MDF2189877.1 hypothetical protein [Paraflavitalea sp. CAU 1676]
MNCAQFTYSVGACSFATWSPVSELRERIKYCPYILLIVTGPVCP